MRLWIFSCPFAVSSSATGRDALSCSAVPSADEAPTMRTSPLQKPLSPMSTTSQHVRRAHASQRDSPGRICSPRPCSFASLLVVSRLRALRLIIPTNRTKAGMGGHRRLEFLESAGWLLAALPCLAGCFDLRALRAKRLAPSQRLSQSGGTKLPITAHLFFSRKVLCRADL
jgi:hypothetical protein